MSSQDNILQDILNKWDSLQQSSVFNLFIGMVIGMVVVYLLASLEDRGVSDRRVHEIESKLERIKKIETRLAEL
jgi:uncharacterized membrane protein